MVTAKLWSEGVPDVVFCRLMEEWREPGYWHITCAGVATDRATLLDAFGEEKDRFRDVTFHPAEGFCQVYALHEDNTHVRMGDPGARGALLLSIGPCTDRNSLAALTRAGIVAYEQWVQLTHKQGIVQAVNRECEGELVDLDEIDGLMPRKYTPVENPA